MAKSGNWKWCVVIVVVLVLFVHFRQRNAVQRTVGVVRTAELQTADEASSDLYTAAAVPDTDVPVIDELHLTDSVEAQIPDTAEVHIPMMDLESPDDQNTDSFNDETVGTHQPQQVVVLPAQPPQRIPGFVEQPGAEKLPSAPAQLSGAKQYEAKFSLPEGVRIAATEHIDYGKSLARRGAAFGARQEFVAALRLVAQAKDNQFNTTENSAGLFAALTAFKESDDFYFAQSEDNGRVDVRRLVQRHQSKILSPQQCATMTPMAAMQAYYQFVQQQLVKCSGSTVVAGEALYCLGKVHGINAKNSEAGGTRLNNARSLVFHDAAFQCDPRNYRSANELGVLMARSGRLDKAKQLFLQSLKIRQLPKVWANLAEVHKQLGEQKLAQLADSEYRRMLDSPPAEQTAGIKWLSPEQFAADSMAAEDVRTAQRTIEQSNVQKKSESDQSSFKKIFKRFF